MHIILLVKRQLVKDLRSLEFFFFYIIILIAFNICWQYSGCKWTDSLDLGSVWYSPREKKTHISGIHFLANFQPLSGTLQQHLIFRGNHCKRNASDFSIKMMKSTHNLNFPIIWGMAAFLSALKIFQKADCFKHSSIMHQVHFLFAVLPQQLNTDR